MNKSSSLVANYLYLRGMLRAACGQNIKVHTGAPTVVLIIDGLYSKLRI